ncbi:efflux RND transporter permease subunit [Candidatus Uhrbacteria bacterium]|nr:efflux RND transporter permease subunit [Candidatus Uhrbacteria bacterium]
MEEHQSKQNGSSDRLYLERLSFKPELRKSILNFFVTNFRVVVLLIIMLTMIGSYSFAKLPRESNPEVKIPIAVIITSYPGASPTDIEELVTKKVETGIFGLKNVNKVTSKSSNSLSAVTVEFDAKADLDDSFRKLRDAVNNLKKNLPTDAKEPVVQEVSIDDTPIWTASFTGPMDGFTLRKNADDIKDELEKIPGVRTVRISGGDEREFDVSYDPGKLTYYGLSLDQVNAIIRATNTAIPSGTFEGKQYNFPVRTDARFYDAKSLAEIPVFHSDKGAIVTLGDIATVRETAIEKTVLSRFGVAGQPSQNSITIEVIKKTGGNIIESVEEINKRLQESISKLPAGTTYNVISNQADRIEKDFDQLTHDFLLTVVLVFTVLFLIVGLKEALVAGLAIPLVFFATFGVMLMTGTSLNFLSLFSLILSLGLLVDDAIVVVSATKQYLNSGKFTPEEAVLLVLNDFKVVLLTTTLTTVWAFVPLLSASGIIGEYIKSIPITVSVTLISSLFIALFINHPLAAILERIRLTKGLFAIQCLILVVITGFGVASKTLIGMVIAALAVIILISIVIWYVRGGKTSLTAAAELTEREWIDDDLIKKKLLQQSHHDSNVISRIMHGVIKFDMLLPIYGRIMSWILSTRKNKFITLSIVSLFFIGAVSLPITGIVKTEFFPAADSELLYVNIEGPTGLSLTETDKITRTVEERVMKMPYVVSYSTLVGVSSANGNGGGSSASHLASITVHLVPEKERPKKSYEISSDMRQQLADIATAKITVNSPAGGPPAGADFDAQITGEDLQQLDKIAKDLKPILDAIPGVYNSSISLKSSPAAYTFTLDPKRLELYQLNAASVGSVLRTAISSSEITTVIRDGKEIKVQARFEKDRIPNLDAIQNLQVLNARHQPVFLKDVAKITLEPSVDTITRINRKRTIQLTSDVDAKHRPADVVASFQKELKEKYTLPNNYTISFGGQNEQNNESVLSILRAMIIASLLIISTMIVQFNSFRQSILVLATIPLALIGVFSGLAITGIYLSFPGLIGIVALFGIVVKNAIILVDKINLNIKFGIPFIEAIIDAGRSRLEAIFITSICTILGILPITLSNDTWRALGGAMIFGLMMSSFFTLFVVPTLYAILNQNKSKQMITHKILEQEKGIN